MILQSDNGFNIENSLPQYNNKTRSYAIIHPPAEAPLCRDCLATEVAYFDLSCLKCLQLLLKPETNISQIFAVLRQWNPHTQRSIKFCIQQILERGGHVNDRDSVSDMSLLHFACKAGAAGIGDPQAATEVVQDLISRGADVFARCRWTQMTPLHYAVLFDAASIVRILLNVSHAIDIESPCNDYENGTALHIAAANLAVNSAAVLVDFGANTRSKDNLGRTPLECIPDGSKYQHIPHTEEIIHQLREILLVDTKIRKNDKINRMVVESVAGKALLKTMDLHIGDRILIDKAKTGTLRYCGTVGFASGVWVGIELDAPEGKNDGIVQDTIYFKCSANHGLFVPVNRVSKIPGPNSVKSSSSSSTIRNSDKHLTSKSASSKNSISNNSTKEQDELYIGNAVTVTTLSGTKHRGIIRFKGETKFATGIWYGVELDKPEGRNNGSVQGIPYFTCPDKHGLFATYSKLQKIPEDVLAAEETVTMALRRSSVNIPSKPKSESPAIRRSFSARHRENESRVSPPRIASKSNPIPRQDNKPQWQSIPVTEASKPKKKANQHWLAIGMNVLFNHQVGVIKYIGRVQFAEGVWLGLEMRDNVGRHDGQVQGYRYFHCKANRGLMVRPSSVTVRGINGANLVKPD